MIYMGSKNRIAKDLLPIITKYLTKDRWYVEPFCGGCNMIDKVNHNKRIANDYNKYLIALFKALQDGVELPTYISKEEYNSVRQKKMLILIGMLVLLDLFVVLGVNFLVDTEKLNAKH